MKLILPEIINDDSLVSTNVIELITDEWDIATTYDIGDYVYVADGQVRKIYESIDAGNIGNDPETSEASWTYRSSTYAAYASLTTYGEGDIVIDAASHRVYESLQAANTGNAPADSPLWWLLLGSSEPWKAFDAKVGSQVVRTGEIQYALSPGIIEGIAIFRISAASVQVEIVDPVDGVVYDETVDLISTENVIDGYTYCFEPVLMTQDVLFSNLPPYGTAEITITVSAGVGTEDVRCGEIVLGRVRSFGSTQYGAGFEVVDYSRKSVDAFGDFSVVQRAFSKRTSFDVFLQNSRLSYLKSTLESYRATPVVCSATDAQHLEAPFLVYGFYRNARIVVNYPCYAIMNIEWEGLT